MFMLKAIVVIALLGFVAAADVNMFNDTTIQFHLDDNSPSFTFWDNDDVSDTFNFGFSALQEYEGDKMVAGAGVDLTTQPGSWSAVGVNGSFSAYTTAFTLDQNDIKVTVNATFYEKETTLDVGSDDTVHVPENSLKWTILIQGWKFKKFNNTLQVQGTAAASNGTTSEFKDDGKNLFVGAKSHWMWVNFPTEANTDFAADAHNFNATVVVNATNVNNTKHGSLALFTIDLPYSVADIAYDPTVTITDNSSAGTSSGSKLILYIILACVTGAIVAIILAFVVVLLLRRKRSQYEAV
eukprot:TRINITY_DN14900_c1_g1_i1.p1 TRINITY_DN14900_c1_g1~~TRINITY_DN14900_c1_g1_i1.p1  ORF type:complete len:321 (+),score=121.61 TRINITY_DN14900_c1_g1_i1:77-964(+)